LSILSVYLSDHHSWDSTTDYIRRLQPAWVRIHQPTARAIWRVQQAAPNAKIMLRSWDIDDHNGDRKREVYADPRGAAFKHMEMWRQFMEKTLAELRRNPWYFDKDNWYLGLLNEPDPAYLPQVIEYTKHVMDMTAFPLGVMCSSVGTFGKPGEPNSWELVKPLEQAIRDGGHVLMVHEYWQPESPSLVWTDDQGRERVDAGNLAWRHRHIPLDVPILVGEAGANGYIYNRHSSEDNAGWQRFMSPAEYAAQVREYIRGCDSRVQGVCLFMTDYHSDQWRSFDTTPAHDALLTVKDTKPAAQSHTVHVPAVVVDGPQIESGEEELDGQPVDGSLFDRSMEFVSRWEGGLSLDPNDPGNYYDGKLVGTKYGISAAVWGGLYDIPNLTREQANAIYRQHYWQASGADVLPWPGCLIVLDTAVLHGAGTAAKWRREVGPSPLAFAAKRLQVYVQSERWHYFGNAWVRRVAELLEVASGKQFV
jgi:hypothetical protein